MFNIQPVDFIANVSIILFGLVPCVRLSFQIHSVSTLGVFELNLSVEHDYKHLVHSTRYFSLLLFFPMTENLVGNSGNDKIFFPFSFINFCKNKKAIWLYRGL